MRKRNSYQFSILLAFVATTLIAVLLAEATQASWRPATHFITIALIELIACAVAVEVLTRNIPSALAKDRERNCLRVDGSWSGRRHKMEEASLRHLRWELRKAFMIVALMSNAFLGVFHFELIPIPIALQAVSSLRFPDENRKESLRADGARFDRWYGPAAALESESRKRMLLHGWPVIVAAGISWCLVAFGFIAHAYFHALKRLSLSIRFRSQQYRLRDLHASVGHDDFAKVKVV